MKKLGKYIRESYQELMTKVSWPTVAELQSTSVVVMVASLIIGLIIFLMDVTFQLVLKEMYQLFG